MQAWPRQQTQIPQLHAKETLRAAVKSASSFVAGSQAIRSAFCLAILVAVPVVSDQFAARAEFVIDAKAQESDNVVAAVRTQDLEPGVVVYSHSSVSPQNDSSSDKASIAKLMKSLDDLLAAVKNRTSSGGNEPPLPGPERRQPPSNSDACGSTGGGTTDHGSSVQVVGLASVPVLIGPELATRLLAREGDFLGEELARPLFRPPRA